MPHESRQKPLEISGLPLKGKSWLKGNSSLRELFISVSIEL